MPTQEFVARAYLMIDGVEVECMSIDNESNSNTNRVNTMNRQNRTRGYTQGIPEESFTANMSIPHGGHGIDFYEMKRAGTSFGAAIEYEDGSADIYTDAIIDRMSKKVAMGEPTELTLECLAIEMQHQPA